MASIEVENKPFVQEIAIAADDTITLDPERQYELIHLGKNAAGAASTNDVFFSTDGTAVDADYSSESDKVVLQDGKSILLPPDITTLKAKAVTAVTSIMIVPRGKDPEKLIG